jgi:hydrogenase nickel incorporation protein HypA/HybF
MHELSVCQALVDQLEALVQEHGARRVCRVVVRVGVLSGIEPELLRQAYPIACAGTVAEGSRLDIENAPVRVHCPSCGAETDVTTSKMTCGLCGNWRTRLISGGELVLVTAELEKPERGTDTCATPVGAM